MYPERLSAFSSDGTGTADDASVGTASNSENAPLVNSSPDSVPGGSASLDINFKVETALRRRRVTLSRYGHRRLIRAGACFSRDEDSVRLLLTGTLPGSTRESFRVLADNSNYVTHRLCNWLTRRQHSAKWLYAWEFQKRGALHLHLAIEVTTENAEFIKREFKHEWNRLLSTIGNRNGVDMWAKSKTYSHSREITQTDVTVCEKEPSRYIAKYIAKGNAKSFVPNRFPPVRWYQISRALLRELEDKTEVYEREALSYRQAREFVELATHNLYNYQLCGSREFRGVVYSWSGYGYGEDFKIEDYGGGLMKINKEPNNSRQIAMRIDALSRHYPLMRCYLRWKGYSDLLTRIATGIATQEESLEFIELGMDAAMLGYEHCNDKERISRVLRDTDIWLANTCGIVKMSPEFSLAVNKNCNEQLTA